MINGIVSRGFGTWSTLSRVVTRGFGSAVTDAYHGSFLLFPMEELFVAADHLQAFPDWPFPPLDKPLTFRTIALGGTHGTINIQGKAPSVATPWSPVKRTIPLAGSQVRGNVLASWVGPGTVSNPKPVSTDMFGRAPPITGLGPLHLITEAGEPLYTEGGEPLEA